MEIEVDYTRDIQECNIHVVLELSSVKLHVRSLVFGMQYVQCTRGSVLPCIPFYYCSVIISLELRYLARQMSWHF